MEEEVAGLRIALEQLQVQQDRTVQTIQQRFTLHEREWERQIQRQGQQIDQLMTCQLHSQDNVRQENASLQAQMDRLGAEQSLLWDAVGRVVRDATTTTAVVRDKKGVAVSSTTIAQQQQHDKSHHHHHRDQQYITKQQLHYETEQMMQFCKTSMSDLVSFVDSNLDHVRETIVQLRTETRQWIDSTLKQSHGQTKRQHETLASQVNETARAIEDVKEDQEVSNMALIDTMSCMKTKFDEVLEEWQMYGLSTTNSMLADDAPTMTRTTTGNLMRDAFNNNKDNNNNKNDRFMQLLERKNGQWSAQFKRMRTDIRTLQREGSDLRQDVQELNQLVVTSVGVLSQQAETTASLCEKQLQQINDLVRKEFVSTEEFHLLEAEFIKTGKIWSDRFREILHALEYYHDTANAQEEKHQQSNPENHVLPSVARITSPNTPNVFDSSAPSREYIETATTKKKVRHRSVDSNPIDNGGAPSRIKVRDIIDLTGVISDERDDVEPTMP